ncbi:nicotinamide riboside transporter PnuC [Alteromonas sp. ASW11-36]|uniref:Nicotinamide riboside transporter PnuC n=1 Tax=Alteromonas arenosi TaxID=3055817 RepID=A0ABT7SWX3_9ALTE|nr:nicotinamide riboside transporter PnuC [Alteromonas sp. ASW11-36]MDM7860054.1 nicotinamide riboside transporter PnuC [Alteromonas sp. ASW11-36]
MNNLLVTAIEQMRAMHLFEGVAVILAIAYVLLAARKHIACWACAFVSTLIYTVLFYDVNLKLQMLLNLYYMLMALYGYWQWKRSPSEAFVASRLTVLQNIGTLTVIVLFTVLCAEITGLLTESRYLYVDAFVTVASVITTVMVAHRKIENWLYWMVINSVASWLYWQVDLYFTSLLFVSYVFMSVYGYLQWRKSTKVAMRELSGAQ